MTARSMLPPGPALRPAGAILATLVAAGAFSLPLGGPIGLLGLIVGVMTSVAVVTVAVGWVPVVTVVVASAALGALGVLVRDDPWLAAALVGVAGLAQIPLSRWSAGIGAMVPVAAAMGTSIPVADDALAFGGWVVAGGVLMVAIAAVLGAAVEPDPVPAGDAWRHGVVAAVAVAVAAFLTVGRGIDHGYWLVLTLAVVLRPVGGDTVTRALDRSVGTVLGVAVAVVVVIALPTPVALVIALACLLLAIAWALAGDERRHHFYTTPAIVLLASSGVTSSALGIAAERFVFTLVGALAATATALLLARWPVNPAPSPPPPAQP